MYPVLFHIPLTLLAAIAGAIVGAAFGDNKLRNTVIFALLGAAVLSAAAFLKASTMSVPVQGYGSMILLGFLTGVGMAARRAHLIGVEPRHCVDIGIFGVIIGLAGSRFFHIIVYWPRFNPFVGGSFHVERIVDMFKIWEGGLVFYGAFLTVIPATWLYCRHYKLPPIKFLDLSVPSLIAGQAFGRIGCLLNGCCYGKTSDVPWGIHFPPTAPAYMSQVRAGLDVPEACSLAVHPTQIYASIAATLTAAFLYTYWPRRKYDGQILSLMLIMAGTMRFFEELLRNDEPALWDAVPLLTVAMWIGLAIVIVGFALLLYFRSAARSSLAPPGRGST